MAKGGPTKTQLKEWAAAEKAAKLAAHKKKVLEYNKDRQIRILNEVMSLEKELSETGGDLFEVEMDNEVYHRHGSIGQSDCKTIIEKSPMHYVAGKDPHEKEPSEAMLLGSAMHMALLEPDLFHSTYAVPPESKKDGDQMGPLNRNPGKQMWEAFKMQHWRKIPLKEAQRDQINLMLNSLSNCPEAQELLRAGGLAERAFFRAPPEPYQNIPVSLKIKPDLWLPKQNIILDLKTCIDASKNKFEVDIRTKGYFIQAAFYCDVIAYFTGEYPIFKFLAIEKSPPYDMGIFTIDDVFLDMGRAYYREALSKFAECYEKEEWPGYTKETQVIKCPQWFVKDFRRQTLEFMSE